METTRTYELDNTWVAVFTPENIDEEGRPYNLLIQVGSYNGKDLEEQITGQIKRSGCCDWGFNEPVMLHLCGQKDSTLFTLIFNDAIKILGSHDDEL